MKFIKILLCFILGLAIYSKEVIITLIALKIFGYNTALLLSLSMIASSITMKKSQSLFSKLFDVIVDEIN